MSEFSQSYHLVGDDQGDAVSLLRRAGARGFVFPPSNHWTTLVVETSDYGEVDDRVVAANTGTLLHYVHAEDHGWELAVFQGPDVVTRYACRWDEEIEISDEELDMSLLEDLSRNHGSAAGRAELEEVLHPADFDEIFENDDLATPADRFCRLLGLAHASWLSWHYFTSASATGIRDQAPGIVEVSP